MVNWVIRSSESSETERIGEYFGALIDVPEVIELRSDLGGGKTTFVKGLVGLVVLIRLRAQHLHSIKSIKRPG
jgi:tRNA A37 threonylcarbamoyladenosine biosynthesis protein TsaE